MYIKDGIAYAGEQPHVIVVRGVRPMDDYKLWVRFSNGEAKVCDIKPLLYSPAFAPLKAETTFREVYIDYGTTVWMDGDIDIAPEYLFENGIAADSISA